MSRALAESRAPGPDAAAPEKSAGQMNALFIVDGSSLFFRFADNHQKIHGEGKLMGNHLAAQAIDGPENGFFYFDAVLDPTNPALRGTATGVEDDSIVTRRFFLKKETP